MMTIGDHDGRIFLSHPHTHGGYFVLLTTFKTSFILEKTWKSIPENSEYDEMRHGDVILTLQ